MLIQFKVVSDNSLWSIDSDKFRYARLSRSLVDIAENPTNEPAVEEFGELKLVHPVMEVYRLEGRSPTTEGPGCGLTSVAVVFYVTKTKLKIIVSANVDITEPVLVSAITEVECEVGGQTKMAVH